MGLWNSAAAVENIMAVFQKIKNTTSIRSGNSTSRYISKRILDLLKIYLHTLVHNTIIHNSQKVEATQVSTDGWTNKENVVYTYKWNTMQP